MGKGEPKEEKWWNLLMVKQTTSPKRSQKSANPQPNAKAIWGKTHRSHLVATYMGVS